MVLARLGVGRCDVTARRNQSNVIVANEYWMSKTVRHFVRLGASRLDRTICSAAGEAGLKSVYGAKLVETTWQNSIADFPTLSVGVTYLPIPVGAVILLLFVIERLTIGLPPWVPAKPASIAFD